MSEKIKIGSDSLSAAVKKQLNVLPELIAKEIDKEAKKAAKHARNRLKAESPKRSGNYSKSWAVKPTPKSRTGGEYTVHNVKHYRLTHLIEKGFQHQRAGRKIPGRPRIKPIEIEAVERFERAVGGIIK